MQMTYKDTKVRYNYVKFAPKKKFITFQTIMLHYVKLSYHTNLYTDEERQYLLFLLALFTSLYFKRFCTINFYFTHVIRPVSIIPIIISHS